MKLRLNSIVYDVLNCEFDYETTVFMNMKKMLSFNRSIYWYDYTSTYDYRQTTISFKHNSTDANTIINLFDKAAQGRNETIELLADKKQVFYPAGPDLGNDGVFEIDVLSNTPGAMLFSPWRYFDASVTYNVVSTPSYSIPIEVSDGDVTVGSVTNLSYPTVSLNTERNLIDTETNSGTINRIDLHEVNDNQILELSFKLRQTKAAKLINYLTTTARSNSFNIVANSGNWLFGAEGGTSGTYSVKLASNQVHVAHRKPYKWIVTFSVYREKI